MQNNFFDLGKIHVTVKSTSQLRFVPNPRAVRDLDTIPQFLLSYELCSVHIRAFDMKGFVSFLLSSPMMVWSSIVASFCALEDAEAGALYLGLRH